MILKTRNLGDVQTRAFGTSEMVPAPWAGFQSQAGEVVTTASSVGLPAVGRAIRLVGGLVGTALLTVFEGRKGDKRERPDSPQALLFAEPLPGVSDYDWRDTRPSVSVRRGEVRPPA